MRIRGGGLGWPEADEEDTDSKLGWPDTSGEVEKTGETDDGR